MVKAGRSYNDLFSYLPVDSLPEGNTGGSWVDSCSEFSPSFISGFAMHTEFAAVAANYFVAHSWELLIVVVPVKEECQFVLVGVSFGSCLEYSEVDHDASSFYHIIIFIGKDYGTFNDN